MSTSKLLCCGFLLLVFFISNTVAQDSWSQGTNMPSARACHGVEIVNNKIYAMGGNRSGATLEEYDPATDTWATKRDMPTERPYISCSVVNEKIYVIGGYTPETLSTVEEYDPATDRWSTKSPIPTARWGHATATVNGKIYAIGGADGWPATMCHTTEEYDPKTDEWTTKASIPTSRWMLSCSAVDGKIYAIGGYQSGLGTFSSVEVYDPETDSWTIKSPMPTARWGLTTGTVNGKIYAIGGGDVYLPTQRYGIVEEYDPVTDSWTTKTAMPVGRIGLAPFSPSVDGKIYVIGGGGLSSADAYPTVYIYDSGTGTGIKNRTEPANFHLHQNYPNPFNLLTTIGYSLLKSDFVTLKIFNLVGQEVDILVNALQTAGDHQISWEAEEFPSGIYYYKLQTGEFSETRKLILQK